jgi:hypothetical protein
VFVTKVFARFARKERLDDGWLCEAIARAGRNDLGQKVADLLLVCFRGDGVAGRYGIGASETIAFGDSWNDLPMLKWAEAKFSSIASAYSYASMASS